MNPEPPLSPQEEVPFPLEWNDGKNIHLKVILKSRRVKLKQIEQVFGMFLLK